MTAPLNRRSLFAQRLDRIAFAAYFLGAIVPLAALGWVIQRNELQGEGAFGWIGLLVSVAVLSLGAYLALRRTIHDSLGRMERDQQRISRLLGASEEFAQLQDRHSSEDALLRHAIKLAQASGSFLVERDANGEWTVASAAGVAEAEALLDAPFCEALDKVVSPQGQAAELAGGGLLCVGIRPESGASAVLVVLPEVGSAFTEGTCEAVCTLGALGSVAFTNSDLRHAQRNFFAHVTELLTTALDVHLGYHGGHGHRSAELCNRVGHELGLDSERLQALHFAALLHDIGMLKRDRDLDLPPSAWTPHCRHGHDMLQQIRFWESSAPIVLRHHERWDGSGYPDGVAGEAIPLEARILSVCDAFDSMTAESSYRSPLSFREALQELQGCSGTQFDPDVVAAFLSLVEQGIIEPAGADVEEPALVG